ncbi:MAG: SAM-dependent DNA methyltransferase [Trueperaceae bacterium]|nr:SAM-dependent DNA methyltransferase [Trueperaceae bacterium]
MEQNLANFIWGVADLLRGDFKQSQYGRVILPFTLLRRLECVLEPTRDAVLQTYETQKDQPDILKERLLRQAAKQPFYNTSAITLTKLGENDTYDNLVRYLNEFSKEAKEIFDYFKFVDYLDQLNEVNLLYKVAERFKTIDLSPEKISNHEMGLIFEELIRRFAESSNETAGEHFTPRDIVKLTTDLLFIDDSDSLTLPGKIITIYDPTAGTGGFLSSGMEHMLDYNREVTVRVFGQELNPESYAICKGDMLIKGQDVSQIKYGNTLSDDQLSANKFDYMLSNPPFGVDWKKVEKAIKDESARGYEGRFGPGLPRVSDGSLLFLLHLISKMRDPQEGGSRIGIILNGSPLFTGSAGSGESSIRRYILENDLLEGIIALPTDMFYNTGIATYIWLLSNRKSRERKGKVQLVNATEMYSKMRKSLGSKRNTIENYIADVVRLYGSFAENEQSKVFDTTDFGYRRITVERPLKLCYYPHDPERQANLKEDNSFQKLSDAEQAALLMALNTFESEVKSERTFYKLLENQVQQQALQGKHNPIKLNTSLKKALQKHLSEQDDTAETVKSKGKIEASSDLRDYENVPLKEDIHAYFAGEVKPHVPDAWIDESKTDELDGQAGIVGYEIPFNRHFYSYTPPRPLEEIDAELDVLSAEIMDLLREVHV